MKQSLGRGLESLIPPRKTKTSLESNQNIDWRNPAEKESIFNIEIDKIKPNPFQPRKDIAAEGLRELAESIREHGVLQPLIVTKIEKITERGQEVEYELVAGERRWRAAKIAGLLHVPVIIRGSTTQNRNQKLEIALVENIQRQDLNPIETALAFKRLYHEFNLKQHEIGKKVGKSRVAVANFLRLLSLPQKIQQSIAEGKISEGHGRAILMTKPENWFSLFSEIVRKGLTVRQTEDRARQLGVSVSKASQASRAGKLVSNPFFRKLEQQLFDFLGQGVKIKQRGQAGSLVVEFRGLEELKQIIKKILERA